MANDDGGGLPAGGGNCSLEEFRISHTILERKVDSISNDLRRTIDTLRVVTENLRIREDRAPPVRRAYVSPMGACGQRRARRHVQPAPPEFSESDEGGIRHRRYCGRDLNTDEEVEQWILGEPRFAAQPRYLHHLQPSPPSHRYRHSHPPPSSSSSWHHIQAKNQIPTNLYSLQPAKTQIQTPSQPSSSTRSQTHTRRPNQSPTHHKRETHKPQFHRFENAHENQFKIPKTHSRFGHHNSVTKYKPPTLTDMMHFVSNWFDCEEVWVDESAKSERSNIIESELCKNEIGDDSFCDELGDRVVGGGNSVQEKLSLKNEELCSIECSIEKLECNGELERKIKELGLSRRSTEEFNVEIEEKKTELDLIRRRIEECSCEFRKREGELDVLRTSVSDWTEKLELKHNQLSETERLIEVQRNVIVVVSKSECDNERAGVLVGAGMGGLAAFSDGVKALIEKGHRKVTPFFIPHAITTMGSALLAIDLGFIGPNYSISTACATSNYCFYDAANHIRRGEADMMIAGGTKAAINPIGLGGFVACRELSQRNDDKIVFSILGIFTQPMVEEIDLGVVIEAHIGFSEFKIKCARRHQWLIAWSFSACRWTIVLLPLWVWDALRRDFSVGVYYSHKPNRGLRSIVVQLVLVPCVSTELEVEFFSKKGRLM